ncbi:MAG: hypothetical protein ACO3CX_05095 [Ilumatobacteraceae bacterium]
MTAFSFRTETRKDSLRDLAAIWVTLTLTLAYLEVPIVNAPLFATALTLQAALGTVAITWLLKGVQPSLLLLLGPGLILGGALSFALFQLVGRGALGIIAATFAGIASVAVLFRSFAPEGDQAPRWWMLGQLVGMGMLAIAPEFAELLPLILTFFFLGFLTDPYRKLRQPLTFTLCVLGLAVSLVAYQARPEYWWVVTDDYLFLEVMSRHLVVEGPFADWGLSNFARYHWLAYGWSGLSNLLGGEPAPLITLTRVMPITYAFSMASSLLLLLKRLHGKIAFTYATLPIWVVVAVGRFEWTGTSTGAAYAVLAAAVVLLQLSVANSVGVRNILMVFMLFVPVLALTKLPSLFALTAAAWCLVAVIASKRFNSLKHSRVTLLVISLAAIPGLFFGVFIFSSVLDRIHFSRVNPGLGQLSEFGIEFVIGTLILNQLWLWLGVAVLVWQISRMELSETTNSWAWLVAVAVISIASALAFELTLSGATNTYTYFSGPLYFLASLSFLATGVLENASNRKSWNWKSSTLTVSMLAAGILWGWAPVSGSIWEYATSVLPQNMTLRVEMLKFYTSQRLFAATVIFLLAWAASSKLRRSKQLLHSFQIAVVLLAFASLQPAYSESLTAKVSAKEISEQIGSPAAIVAGTWLKEHSLKTDVIASNHYRGDRSVVDIALAVWSQREFLVLGPQIGYQVTSQSMSANRLSQSFADGPTSSTCGELLRSRVRWFIVDQDLTPNRDWSLCSTEEFEIGNFTVLSLQESMQSP